MTDGAVRLEPLEYEAGKLVASVCSTAHEASTANRHGSYGHHRAVVAIMHDKEATINAVLFDRLGIVVATGYPSAGATPFFPEIKLVFRVSDARAHYHVPVVVSPFGYSTNRGN